MALGTLRKMRSVFNNPIHYYLPLGEEEVLLNDVIGHTISMEFSGDIYCVDCGKKTKKSFAQGFCYRCFISSPLTEECVLRPELCRAQEGEARDMEFAKNHCLIDHYVYLANTSSLKVGVTRHHQIPTRWIDQGASYAVQIAKTTNRYEAGLIEVALKDHMADKTNWRNMLKNIVPDINLKEKAVGIKTLLPEKLQDFVLDDIEVTALNYPVIQYPQKVMSLSFDKTATVSGKLLGIKGQYLLFENDFCINIRKFGGYEIELKIN